MAQNHRPRKIPGPKDWVGYEADLDVRHAHRLMFGKTVEEVKTLFGGTGSIERADELLFMPRRAFQYYVFAFVEYVISIAAEGDSDSASSFLRLLINREKRDSGSVTEIYGDLASAVEEVALNQSRYDADVSIYGDFRELAAQVERACSVA